MDFFDRANQGKALRKKKAAMHNDGGGVDKAMDVPEFVCGLVRLAHAAGLACFPPQCARPLPLSCLIV